MFKNKSKLVQTGLVLLLLCLFFQSQLFAQDKRETVVLDGDIKKNFKLQEGGTFSVENINGKVEITSWNKDEVEIEIIERRRGDDELEFEFDARPNRVEVTVYRNRDRSWNRRSTTADILVKVPKKVELFARTTNGNVEITNIDGEVEARTTNGSLDLRGINGNVEANTTNGKVELEGITGDVRSITTNATIYVVDTKARRMTLRTTNGRIKVECEIDDNGDYDFGTTNGDIDVKIPSDSKFDADIRCSARGFDSDFSELKDAVRDSRSDSRDRRNRYNYSRNVNLREKVNGGGADLRVRTTNGDISVRHR